MLIVISPAKSLDFTPVPGLPSTRPRFEKDTAALARTARRLKAADLKRMMHISDDLAALNVARFRSFDPEGEGVQAALAFNGDVYQGLQARTLDTDALAWAQDGLRILSGLYGLLRPMDAIQPYRLEMGVRLHTRRGESLYDYWGDRISKQLNADAAEHSEKVLINLASQEYFGAVNRRALKLPVVTCQFKEEKDGVIRTLAFFAKKARGLMARYVIDRRLERSADLKAFDTAGYRFRPDLSDEAEWVFVRPQPESKG
jgi:hypothetical protein